VIAVVDASAALKWQFRDEDATDPATDLLGDFMEGKIDLISPSLFTYEIISAVNVAIERKRLSEEDGYKAIVNITSVRVELKALSDLIERTFRMARRYHLSPYDCAYLTLAEKEESNFVTGDKKLFNACHSHFPWVKWIGDYKSSLA
jgi:predicted nucleic acid-binding protein